MGCAPFWPELHSITFCFKYTNFYKEIYFASYSRGGGVVKMRVFTFYCFREYLHIGGWRIKCFFSFCSLQTGFCFFVSWLSPMSIAVQRWLPLQQILGVDLEYDQDAQDGADEADQHWQNHNEPEGSPRAVGQMSEVRAVVLRVELVHRVGVRLEQTGADDVLLMVRVARAGRDGRLQRGLGRRRRPFRFA